jgi:hypothetical protein
MCIRDSHIGGRDFKVTVSESDCGPADETIIAGLPIKGVIISQIVSLISGGGATVDPVIGIATNPGALAVTTVASNDTAAAQISNLSLPPIPFITTDGKLYMRSQPDAGLSVIQTVYLIKAGW